MQPLSCARRKHQATQGATGGGQVKVSATGRPHVWIDTRSFHTRDQPEADGNVFCSGLTAVPPSSPRLSWRKCRSRPKTPSNTPLQPKTTQSGGSVGAGQAENIPPPPHPRCTRHGTYQPHNLCYHIVAYPLPNLSRSYRIIAQWQGAT